ncbi:hypothetical protein HDV00_002662 [Rhizophlyctis rosea]|nr:hypothetical protein HDV00_002662 [Rhizophlyctis rosea]
MNRLTAIAPIADSPALLTPKDEEDDIFVTTPLMLSPPSSYNLEKEYVASSRGSTLVDDSDSDAAATLHSRRQHQHRLKSTHEVTEHFLVLLLKHTTLNIEILNKLHESLRTSSYPPPYSRIAPFFNLDPARNTLEMETFPLKRAKLPARVWLDILKAATVAEQEVGQMLLHLNDEARVVWLDGWLRPILSLFDSHIRNIPQTSLSPSHSQHKTARCQFNYTLQTSTLLILMVSTATLHTHAESEVAIAQMMVELKLAYMKNLILLSSSELGSFPEHPSVMRNRSENPEKSLPASPITSVYGILTNGVEFYVFQYDGKDHSVKKNTSLMISFQSSEEVGEEMVGVCEVFYWILLHQWNAGLGAFLKHKHPQPIPLTLQSPQFEALICAAAALTLAEEAYLSSEGAGKTSDSEGEDGERNEEVADEEAEQALGRLRDR